MKHVQIEVTYDRYSAVRTSSHCMCTCNPFLPHSKYRHYCKDWAYSCPWLQRNKKSHSSTCTLFIPQFQCYVLCYIYFNSILTDLPTEIRKTSAMMKPAKDNRNVLLLFHILGVIKKINQSTDSFDSPRTHFNDIFLSKNNQPIYQQYCNSVVLCSGDH